MFGSVDEIIEALGGNIAAASLAGVSPPAVSNWKSRGRIPAEQYIVFSERLGQRLNPDLFGFRATEALP